MKLYKLLNKNRMPGYRYKKFEVGKPFNRGCTDKRRAVRVCTDQAVHAYIHPVQASLFSLSHVDSDRNILWEATTSTPLKEMKNAGDKVGTKVLTIKTKLGRVRKHIPIAKQRKLIDALLAALEKKSGRKAKRFSTHLTTSNIKNLSKEFTIPELQKIYKKVFDAKK